MPRHAVVQHNVVINTIDYDVTPNPVPGFPGDVVAIPNEIAGPGWTFAYATGVFTNPHTPSAEAQAVEDWKILRQTPRTLGGCYLTEPLQTPMGRLWVNG